MLCAAAAPLLAGYLTARIIQGNWGPLVLPIAAVIVAISGPTEAAAAKAQTAPAWLMAVLGSFVLFALGTFAALTKHRWLRIEASPKPN
jgi:sugar phosphate permease